MEEHWARWQSLRESTFLFSMVFFHSFSFGLTANWTNRKRIRNVWAVRSNSSISPIQLFRIIESKNSSLKMIKTNQSRENLLHLIYQMFWVYFCFDLFHFTCSISHFMASFLSISLFVLLIRATEDRSGFFFVFKLMSMKKRWQIIKKKNILTIIHCNNKHIEIWKWKSIMLISRKKKMRLRKTDGEWKNARTHTEKVMY